MDFSAFCLLTFDIKWDIGSTLAVAFWDNLIEKIYGKLGEQLHNIKWRKILHHMALHQISRRHTHDQGTIFFHPHHPKLDDTEIALISVKISLCNSLSRRSSLHPSEACVPGHLTKPVASFGGPINGLCCFLWKEWHSCWFTEKLIYRHFNELIKEW